MIQNGLKRVAPTLVGSGLVGLMVCAGVVRASAQPVASLDERIVGAERVIVARAHSIRAEWLENEYGDRLIVSRIQLRVEEILKGADAETVQLDLDGGTLDGLTLRVSDLPMLEPGERAVFFLDASSAGAFAPHLRGQGILRLDDRDVVRGSSLRLDDIRAKARGKGR
jgi:hypothetical protein